MLGKLAITRQDERGMALAVAIFAIVIVGALVAGALFAGTQEQRVGDSSRRLQQSFGVAELGINSVVRTWDPSTYSARQRYPADSLAVPNALVTGVTPRSSGSFGGYVYRLNDNLYLIDVTGHDTVSGRSLFGGGRARQRLGMLARIMPIKFDIQASLTTTNSNQMAGNATIDGTDHVPTGWSACAPPGSAVAGVRMDSGGIITTSGGQTSVTGTPPSVADPTVKDSTFSQFGSVSYAQLAARANITLPATTYSAGTLHPVVTGGVCDKTNLYNWGDGMNPTQPCGSYFPIIHITAGDVTINGEQGQGILLVDGNLSVQGGFQFYGIVIVKGSLSTAGGGTNPAHFWGTVMVRDSAVLGSNSISGSATLNYSQCAVLTALNNTSPVAPMRSRGWVQLF